MEMEGRLTRNETLQHGWQGRQLLVLLVASALTSLIILSCFLTSVLIHVKLWASIKSKYGRTCLALSVFQLVASGCVLLISILSIWIYLLAPEGRSTLGYVVGCTIDMLTISMYAFAAVWKFDIHYSLCASQKLMSYRRTSKVMFSYFLMGFVPSVGYLVGHRCLGRRRNSQVYESEPYFYYGITGCLLIISFCLLFPNFRRLWHHHEESIKLNATATPDKYSLRLVKKQLRLCVLLSLLSFLTATIDVFVDVEGIPVTLWVKLAFSVAYAALFWFIFVWRSKVKRHLRRRYPRVSLCKSNNSHPEARNPQPHEP